MPPTTTPPRSSIYRTAERAVGNLPEWLANLRGHGASYNTIASMLQDFGVLVTAETVRAWCKVVVPA